MSSTSTIDPAYPGNIIRTALVLEGSLNIVAAAFCFYDPRGALQNLMPTETSTLGRSGPGEPSPLATSLIQWVAGIGVSFTVLMLLSVPNKPGAIELRRATYAMAASLEVIWIALFAHQVFVLGEEGSGLDGNMVLFWMIGPILPLALFRIYVLYVKPEWMGKYRGAKRD